MDIGAVAKLNMSPYIIIYRTIVGIQHFVKACEPTVSKIRLLSGYKYIYILRY